MTFEEFFKKKKISLDLLKAAEPQLFAEFELHYAQMGEKSFDHTKKYWFNALRRKYHTPEEPKVEKVKIENQLAEQTITQAISAQPEAEAPKLGFKPKFKTAAAPAGSTPAPTETESTEEAVPTAKLGFKPKFKSAAASTPTPAENVPAVPEEKTESTEASTEVPVPKLGFKPKFKSAASTPTPAENVPAVSEEKAESTETTSEAPAPKLGFKPKFKAAAPPNPADEVSEQPQPVEPETKATPAPDTGVKPAYKPKFQMKNFKPKAEEE